MKSFIVLRCSHQNSLIFVILFVKWLKKNMKDILFIIFKCIYTLRLCHLYTLPVILTFVSFVINDVLHIFFFWVTVFIFICARKILFIHILKILHSFSCIHKTHFSHFVHVHVWMLSNHNDYECSLTTMTIDVL